MEPMVEVSTAVGKSITLPCDAPLKENNSKYRTSFGSTSIGEDYVLEWEKDGTGNIFSSHGLRDVPTKEMRGRLRKGVDRSLTILEAKRSDDGVYRCVLKFFNRPADHPVGSKVRLKINTLPEFVHVPSLTQFQSYGSTLELECTAKGVPKPTIRWLKDSALLENDERTQISGNRLTVERLQRNDEGGYSCVATNTEGSRKHTTKLVFAEGATFDKPPHNRTVFESANFFWPCHARAHPDTVEYKWYYGDKQIPFAGGLALRAKNERGTLSIKGVERNDAGWFSCVASNGFGEEKVAKAYLTVHYPPRTVPGTPTIQYLPLGLSAQLSCDTDALPQVHLVKWAKNKKLLDPAKHSSRYALRHNGTKLLVKKVEKSDEGVYSCQAFNTVDDGPPFEIHVIVAKPPQFERVPPSQLTRRPGESVEMDCRGSGQPKPKIYWQRRDGRALSGSARIRQTGEALLSIDNLQPGDHGTYECVVENDVTKLVKETRLMMTETHPQAPTNVTVKTGQEEAKISWTPGYRGGAPQSFTVKYRAVSAGGQWSQVDAGLHWQTIINGLTPRTEFEFVVVPHNSYGTGFPSTPVRLYTVGDGSDADGEGNSGAGMPPHAPQTLRVSTNLQRVRFEWKPPAVPSPPVHYYSVEYRPVGSEKPDDNVVHVKDKSFITLKDKISTTRLDLVPSSDLAFDAGDSSDGGIAPGAMYDFRVRAHNPARSPPSNAVRYRIPGMAPQSAIVAAVLGGLLFLLVFLVIGCVFVNRAKGKRKNKANESNHRNRNGSIGRLYSDQQYYYDTTDTQLANGKSFDRNGSSDVSERSRITSVMDYLLCCFLNNNQQDSGGFPGSSESTDQVYDKSSNFLSTHASQPHHPPVFVSSTPIPTNLYATAASSPTAYRTKAAQLQASNFSRFLEDTHGTPRSVRTDYSGGLPTLSGYSRDRLLGTIEQLRGRRVTTNGVPPPKPPRIHRPHVLKPTVLSPRTGGAFSSSLSSDVSEFDRLRLADRRIDESLRQSARFGRGARCVQQTLGDATVAAVSTDSSSSGFSSSQEDALLVGKVQRMTTQWEKTATVVGDYAHHQPPVNRISPESQLRLEKLREEFRLNRNELQQCPLQLTTVVESDAL